MRLFSRAAGEEGRVDVDQVNALARKLAHYVQVVAEEEPVRAGREQRPQLGLLLVLSQEVLTVAERYPLDFLERQPDRRVGVLELGDLDLTGPRLHFPAQRRLVHRHGAEARGQLEVLLLFRDLRLVGRGRLDEGDSGIGSDGSGLGRQLFGRGRSG
jgi:hypothetical protein